MQYPTIPGSDLQVSTLCLGTALLGSAISRPASYELLDTYYEGGGNFLDTAKIYADWLPGEKSASEKTIGAWLQERGLRDQIVLATKGAHPGVSAPTQDSHENLMSVFQRFLRKQKATLKRNFAFLDKGFPAFRKFGATGFRTLAGNPVRSFRLSRTDIVADVEASLRHLGVERIDLYWLHRDNPERPVDDILAILWELVKAGKIRYFGCSNWRKERIRAAQEHARKCGLAGFIANQMLWNAAHVEMQYVRDKTIVVMDHDLWTYHTETQLTAVPYSSQASGWFHRMANGTTAEMHASSRTLYQTPDNEQRFQRVQHLAAELGLSISEVILGYLQSQPFPTIPIIGCRTGEQLHETLRAGDACLSREHLRYIKQEDAVA